MVENAPALASGLPNGSPAGDALRLVQRVGEQVSIGAEAAKAIVETLPASGRRIDGRPFFESTEDEVSTVASAGCPHLPVAGCHRAFEIDERRTEGGRMKDRLTAAKFFQNRQQL